MRLKSVLVWPLLALYGAGLGVVFLPELPAVRPVVGAARGEDADPPGGKPAHRPLKGVEERPPKGVHTADTAPKTAGVRTAVTPVPVTPSRPAESTHKPPLSHAAQLVLDWKPGTLTGPPVAVAASVDPPAGSAMATPAPMADPRPADPVVPMAAQPAPRPGPPPVYPRAEELPKWPRTPAGQTAAAAYDLSVYVGRDLGDPFERQRVQADTRYISLYWAPATDLNRLAVLLDFELNTVSQGPDVVKSEPVPDTGGYLRRVRLSSYRWTRDAFSAVARRDFAFRDLNVNPRDAEFLRRVINVAQDPKTLAVEAVVDGLFLMRDILQTDGRSDTYYDLLYAEQRFGKDAARGKGGEPLLPADPGPEPAAPPLTRWPGGVWAADGKTYPAGAFSTYDPARQAAYDRDHAAWALARKARDAFLNAAAPPDKAGALKKNFPANLKEWEEFWGLDGQARFAKDRGFVIQRGEVVAGIRNKPVGGSYVAYNDRLIVTTRVGTGWHLETYDAQTTAKGKDFLEDPLNAIAQKVEFDAGELLVNLPNGLQAALLVNGQGDRVEVADSRVARNSADHADVTVRTQIGCVQCHGPTGGFISPTNRKLRESLEAGLKLNTRKEADKEAIAAFFLGWEELEATIRVPYEIALRKATAPNPLTDKGWTGAELVATMMAFRDFYDAPPRLDTAAAQLGLSRADAFRTLVLSPTAGLNLVALDRGMPRAAWDQTGADEAFRLVALVKPLGSLIGFAPPGSTAKADVGYGLRR